MKATTPSLMHVPVNMGSVFARVFKHIEDVGANDPNDFIVLSHDTSARSAEHLFSVEKAVPNEEMTTLSGNFLTKVFEGPYRRAAKWDEQMQQEVRNQNSEPYEVHFFYTTCPKCTKAYGKNYVVGVAAIGPHTAA